MSIKDLIVTPSIPDNDMTKHFALPVTDSESQLFLSTKKIEALSALESAVYRRLGEDCKVYFGLNKKGFDFVPDIVKNILIAKQWSDHHDWTGSLINNELTNDFINILEEQYGMIDLSLKLKFLRYFIDDFDYHRPINNIRESINQHNEILQNVEYKYAMNFIENYKNILLNKAFNLYSENKNEVDDFLEDSRIRLFQPFGS